MAADAGALARGSGADLRADVIVVGAGAAGLWVAEVAARGGRDVLVLEKTPRTGTKVLASGGSRCNLTTTLGPLEAARLFGAKGERFLRFAFEALPPRAVRARFAEWGVESEEAPLEKVFPKSGNARDVRDAMERAMRGAGARVELDAGVRALAFDAGEFVTRLADGRVARAPRLVLAAGGKSYPATGTTGDAYAWLGDFGLPVTLPVPALVPLVSDAAWVTELAGIAWQGGEVSLVDSRGKVLARRRRPVVFSHRGVSGPGAMDVSAHVARATGSPFGVAVQERFELRLDLLPGVEREVLREGLVALAAAPGAPRLDRALGTLLGARVAESVPRRLFEALLRQAGVADGIPRCNALDRAARHGVVEALRGLSVPIVGTEGWDKAEVTAGGLELKAVDPRSMAVNAVPGLFVVGELLNVDGPIGGLSFQAAWATAELAGRALANR
ncbi:MAG: aminoacetone oxidase family FAD-binding enzyme [Planctomycetota bacterium]